MNYKALAAGAVLGFMIALTPACGGGQAECGPNNCAGCCNVDGTCVETAAQTGLACGASGQTCVQCAANQQCISGTCTVVNNPPQDAGTDGGGGGCGPQTCSGCCTAGGVCLPGTANTNCGTNGAACQPCPTSGSCVSLGANMGGSCQTPDAGMAVYGTACTQDTDCSAIGAGAKCKMSTTTGNATYTEGYCTKTCSSANDCGATAMCLNFSSYGEGEPICVDRCSATDPCRGNGYACYSLTGSTNRVCWISPLPTPDAGTPAPDNLIGSPCTSDNQCDLDGGFGWGYCYPEVATLPDGGTFNTGYTDGYCAADCGVSPSVCGNTGICLGYQTQQGTFYECADRCADGGVGQSDCRTGYVCQQYGMGLPDGGVEASVDGYCDPSCAVTGCPTGFVCNTLGYCQQGDAGM